VSEVAAEVDNKLLKRNIRNHHLKMERSYC
jgi:hypothetical protein